MADDEHPHPFSNVLSEKFPMPKSLRAPDDVGPTSASVLTEIEAAHEAHTKRMTDLLIKFRNIRRKETEHLGKSSQAILDAIQLRGD